MTRTPGKLLVALVASLALGPGAGVVPRVWAQSTTGTWTHYPPQTPAYSTVVRPPIKANGSSVFTNGSVVPVKFKLLTGPGVFLFDSVWSNNFPEGGDPELSDDFAFLSFAPSGSLTFADITNLTADYAFALGNCQGGSLRWSVTFDINEDDGTVPGEGDPDPRANDRSIFIYYGGYPSFTDCTTGANNQSGVNMIGLTDLRYDTSQLGGTFYDTYANALSLAGPQTGEVSRPALKIASITLAIDSGWMQDETGAYKDQSVTLTRALVNDNVFVPVSGVPAATCDLPTAFIDVIESTAGSIENPESVQPRVADTLYRNTNDCTYSYNLATGSLVGPGVYDVYVNIDGHLILNPGHFTIQ